MSIERYGERAYIKLYEISLRSFHITIREAIKAQSALIASFSLIQKRKVSRSLR